MSFKSHCIWGKASTPEWVLGKCWVVKAQDGLNVLSSLFWGRGASC